MSEGAVCDASAWLVAHTGQAVEERDGLLRFEVADDGVGFDPEAMGYGTGLQGMADRLSALAGGLDVRSAPGAGATIIGSVPISGTAEPPGS